MNILIAGGSGVFLNNLIIKLNKEGHKVSILTGNRFASKEDYHKCFEVYQFPYDAACLNQIFESAVDEELCFKNPCRKIKLPAYQKVNDKNVYSLEQCEKVFQFWQTNYCGKYDSYRFPRKK